MPLFVVATPIGNLEDLSARARRILSEVDAVLAEDTRHSRVLLDAIGVRKPLRAFHDFSSAGALRRIVDELREGASLALVSDAGTPCISDPGYELVRAAHDAGVDVVPIAGPSSVITFLSAAGLPTDRFTFMGFAPRGESARLEQLSRWMYRESTLVYLESPRRVGELLGAIGQIDASREVVAGRELTKLHEAFVRGAASEVAAALAREEAFRGEFVIGIAPGEEPNAEQSEVTAWVESLVATSLSTKDVAAVVSSRLGVSRDDVYRLALEAKKARG